MNPVSQSDLHPGAESLNAFAEQALAEREREQVLAHLAGCGRCRQVVYLAQQAAAELESQPAKAAGARRAHLTASWLAGWRIALIPAAALATAVALAVLVYVHRAERTTQMAMVTPQTAEQSERPVTRPTPSEPAGASSSPVSPVPVMTAERNLKSAPQGAESKPPLQQAQASAALSYRPETYSQSKAVALSNASPEEASLPAPTSGQASPVVGASYPFNAAPAQSSQVKTEAVTAELKQERAAGASPSQPVATPKTQARTYRAAVEEQANPTPPLSAPAQMLDAEPPPTSALENQGQLKMVGAANSRIAKPAPLPSGLTAISTAASGPRLLAVDSAGSLFLSENSGSTWERISRQWTGRAVAVGVRPILSKDATAAPRVANAAAGNIAAGPSAPATDFEIVNDKGRKWSSADGRTWTSQ